MQTDISQDALDWLLDQSPVAAWINCEDRVVCANSAAVRLLAAREKADLIGKSPFDFIAPDFQAVAREGIRSVLSGERMPPLERCLTRLDGSPVYVQVNVAKIAYRGRTAILAMFADISEMHAARERYLGLLRTAAEGIWIADLEGRTEFTNLRLAEMLGAPPGELTGCRLFDCMFPGDRESMRRHLERRREGVSEQYEFRLRRRDGSELLAAISSSPVRDAVGKVTGTLAMVTDVTARQRMERELRQSELRYSTVAEAAPGFLFTTLPDG